MTINRGEFYRQLTEKRKDDHDFRECIEKTVEQLVISDTSLREPGMLLGKIQSGKTRAFLGVTFPHSLGHLEVEGWGSRW